MEILTSAPGQLISGDLSSLWHVSLSVSSCYGSGFLRSEWSKRESKKESSMSFDESSMAYPQMSHIFHSHHILFIKSESVSLVHIKERELKSPPLKTRHILRIYGHIKTTKIGNKTFDRQLFFFCSPDHEFLEDDSFILCSLCPSLVGELFSESLMRQMSFQFSGAV